MCREGLFPRDTSPQPPMIEAAAPFLTRLIGFASQACLRLSAAAVRAQKRPGSQDLAGAGEVARHHSDRRTAKLGHPTVTLMVESMRASKARLRIPRYAPLARCMCPASGNGGRQHSGRGRQRSGRAWQRSDRGRKRSGRRLAGRRRPNALPRAVGLRSAGRYTLNTYFAGRV